MNIEAAVRAAWTRQLEQAVGCTDGYATWEELSEEARVRWRNSIKVAIEVYEAALWRPIADVPKDGSEWLAASKSWETPQAIRWRVYDDRAREEAGENGYWAYAETLINDAIGDAADAEIARPLPLPQPPRGER